MKNLTELFSMSEVASTLLFLGLTAFVGILIGKIEIKKVKLGIAGVLFSGLAFAHFGASFDAHILHFVREFGLILFVYAIGIEVGPRFFSSLRKDGLMLNIFSFSIVFLGFIIALLFHKLGGVEPEVITGIMSGAVTNTPGLGAAQQVLNEMGKTDAAAVTGMGYAIAYPFGVVGIILTMILIRTFFKIKIENEVEDYNFQLNKGKTSLSSVQIKVTNQNIIGQTINEVEKVFSDEFVLSRIERGGEFIIATPNEIIQANDVLYGVSEEEHINSLKLKLGDIIVSDKREVTGDLAMFHILVTSRKHAGKTIKQIGIYRRYDANITRIFRNGLEILATHETVVEFGDTIRVVGKRSLLPEIKKELGNSVKELSHPNTIPIFLGIFLGLILGSIPIFIPGLPAPAKLGMAGGPLIIAILFGHKGRIGKLDFYMTPGANMMIKDLGIILFLACVGLSSGAKFVSTIANGGYIWMVYGAVITFVPIFIVGSIARLKKLNYLKICGIVSGAMTDPPALEFANSLAPIQAQSTAYATVYPLTMFLRILLAQALILLTL